MVSNSELAAILALDCALESILEMLDWSKNTWSPCGCSTIMTGVKCSGKMSPYEGDGDIEQEGTEEGNGLEQGGGGVDEDLRLSCCS